MVIVVLDLLPLAVISISLPSRFRYTQQAKRALLGLPVRKRKPIVRAPVTGLRSHGTAKILGMTRLWKPLLITYMTRLDRLCAYKGRMDVPQHLNRTPDQRALIE